MKKYEVLKNIPEKNLDNKGTTSLKWKKDVIDFFTGKNIDKCLEIGTHKGHSTRILSELFKEIYTIEYQPHLIDMAKEVCKECNNIQYIFGDAYINDTYKNIPNTFGVVVIDCVHTKEHVLADIQRSLNYFDKKIGLYLVFDDYGHPENTTQVKEAVDIAVNDGLKIEKYIGEEPGFIFTRNDGSSTTLIHREGIILSYGV